MESLYLWHHISKSTWNGLAVTVLGKCIIFACSLYNTLYAQTVSLSLMMWVWIWSFRKHPLLVSNILCKTKTNRWLSWSTTSELRGNIVYISFLFSSNCSSEAYYIPFCLNVNHSKATKHWIYCHNGKLNIIISLWGQKP